MEHSERKVGYQTEVFFNEEPVPMVPFVKEILCNVILGLVKTLYGFREDADIRIILKKEK